MKYWQEGHMLKEGGENAGENGNNENQAVEGEGGSVSSFEVVQDFTPIIDEIKEIQKLQYAQFLVIAFLICFLMIREVMGRD